MPSLVDATDRLIHPGLINAHTHGHGNLSKGMGDRWTLELLLTAAPWISGNRTAEDKYLSTYIGALEMLMKGCTACYDLTVEFPQPTPEGLGACAKAYADAGMRAVVAPMVANLTLLRGDPRPARRACPRALQKEVERLRLAPYEASLTAMRQVLEDWQLRSRAGAPCRRADHPAPLQRRVHAWPAPSWRASSASACTATCRSPRPRSSSASRRTARRRPRICRTSGCSGPDFVAAHGVWLDDDDIRRLADHGASVAHNPGSNMLLGNGIAGGQGDAGAQAQCRHRHRRRHLLRQSEHVRVDARRLLRLEGARGRTPTRWLATEEILEAATAGSARALGFGDQIGRIAKGYKADLVFLDLTHINWMPLQRSDQPARAYRGRQRACISVMVGGRMVVENRTPVGVDLASLAKKAEAARERLAAANAGNKQLFERLQGLVNAFCPGLAKTPYHIDRFAGGHHAHYVR